MDFFVGVPLLIIVLFGYIYLLKDKFDYNFGKSLFLSLVLIMFLISVFSLWDIMLIGFYGISIVGIGYFIYFMINNTVKNKKSFEFFNCPAFVFFVVSIIIIIFATNKIDILMSWDECSYWGTMVKKLFYFNTYIGGENFHSMYYPPALTSFNYFVVKYLGMRDSAIYFSQYLFIFSGMIFLIRNIKWQQIGLGIVGFLSGWLLLVLLLRPFLLTLYSEIPLILLVGAAIILLFTSRKKIDYIFVSILLMNAVWIKSNGIVACITVMLMALAQVLYNLFKEGKINKTYLDKGISCFIRKILKYKYLLFVILSPLISQICFNMFLNIHGISNPQSLNGGLTSFIKTLLFDNEMNSVTWSYFDALGKNFNYSYFNMSSISLLSLFIIGFLFLRNIYKNREEKINENKYIGVVYFISYIIYVTALLYSYYFLFSRHEANVLASFDRYINTLIGSIGIGLIGIVIYFSFSKDKVISEKMKNYLIIMLLILFSVVNTSELGRFVKQLLPKTEPPTVEQIKTGKFIGEKYNGRFAKNDKIHLIVQGDYGMTVWATIYYMTPLNLYDPRFDGDNWSIRTPNSAEEPNTSVMSKEEYIQYLEKEKFSHVLIIQSDKNFSKQYSEIFDTDDKNYIVEGVYKFNLETKHLDFEV